jgi:hypothetical protein
MALLLLGWCATRLLGCSGSGSSDRSAGYDPYGGQTGSLTPRCGVAPLTGDGTAVAAGDAVAVVYLSGCSTTTVTVIGPDGNPVDSTLEPLDEAGTYVVRTSAALDPGSYEIALPSGLDAGPEEVAVGQAAPLPTGLGTLTANGVATCGLTTFTLTLDPTALPYVPLIGITASIDQGRRFTWVPYGALELNGTTSTLELNCTGCGAGDHTLTVVPSIAGEAASFGTMTAQFTSASCAADPAGGEPTSPSCNVAQSRATWPTPLALALAGAALLRRRRARPG